jgi:hypothetical protein
MIEISGTDFDYAQERTRMRGAWAQYPDNQNSLSAISMRADVPSSLLKSRPVVTKVFLSEQILQPRLGRLS